jgi:hypothetical protein
MVGSPSYAEPQYNLQPSLNLTLNYRAMNHLIQQVKKVGSLDHLCRITTYCRSLRKPSLHLVHKVDGYEINDSTSMIGIFQTQTL